MAGFTKNLMHLQRHLEVGETIDAAVMGAYETTIMDSHRVRNGVLAATNRRVVFFAKKVGGYDFESFSYENISSFEDSKGMMGGHTIIFHASGNSGRMKWANGDVKTLVQTVSSRAGKTQAPGLSVAEELGQLAVLRQAGTLSDEDWERAKDLFLGKQPNEREAAIDQLKKLGELHRAGILSESEFNSKKWDILVRTN